jgi:hypothetical protein
VNDRGFDWKKARNVEFGAVIRIPVTFLSAHKVNNRDGISARFRLIIPLKTVNRSKPLYCSYTAIVQSDSWKFS